MKLKYILSAFLLLGFTACGDAQKLIDDAGKLFNEPVAIEDGAYATECMPDDANENGEITRITFSTTNGSRQISYETDIYEDEITCPGVATSTQSEGVKSIVLADNGFGNNFSYFTQGEGADEEIIAYYVDDEGAIYINNSEGTNGSLEERFASFILNPETGTKYTRE